MFYLGPFDEDLVKEKPAGPEFFRFSCQQQYFSGKHESESLVRQIGRMGHSSGTNVELCYWLCSVKLPAVLISESL